MWFVTGKRAVWILQRVALSLNVLEPFQQVLPLCVEPIEHGHNWLGSSLLGSDTSFSLLLYGHRTQLCRPKILPPMPSVARPTIFSWLPRLMPRPPSAHNKLEATRAALRRLTEKDKKGNVIGFCSPSRDNPVTTVTTVTGTEHYGYPHPVRRHTNTVNLCLSAVSNLNQDTGYTGAKQTPYFIVKVRVSGASRSVIDDLKIDQLKWEKCGRR